MRPIGLAALTPRVGICLGAMAMSLPRATTSTSKSTAAMPIGATKGRLSNKVGDLTLNLEKCDFQFVFRLCLASAFASAFCGCNSSEQSSADSIWLDAGHAGVVAVERFDSNGDQVIDQAEWTKSPSLAQTFANFDSDGDGKVAASDVTGRL